jgi:hypothetical protein
MSIRHRNLRYRSVTFDIRYRGPGGTQAGKVPGPDHDVVSLRQAGPGRQFPTIPDAPQC